MQRGFKAQATRLALEIRSEFSTSPRAPFDPYAYFQDYGLTVVTIGELEGPARDHFYLQLGGTLSGALIPIGTGFVVLDNDTHPMTRRRATAAHELAHHALEHEFTASISLSERKCGLGGDQESEADVLAGELLIPFESAKAHAFAGWVDEQVAEHYGVSIEFARWRMNASGARKIASRAQQRRAS